MNARIVQSRSNRRLLACARVFVSSYPELVAVLPTGAGHLAGEDLAYQGPGTAGLHRATLIQWAAAIAQPGMAQKGYAPLSSLAQEAVAARVVHAALRNHELEYFTPVASLPGFARALSRTLNELRLARLDPQQVPSDLGRLLAGYQSELAERSLADLATVLEFAAQAVDQWPLAGLPLLLLDAPLETRAHRDFFVRLAGRAEAVLAAVSSGAEHLETMLDVRGENLDPQTPQSSIEHLQQNLFQASPSACSVTAGFEMFSAPGEGLEAVEIARRILEFARSGQNFDHIAILLRNPERYQTVIEEALRRAAIPAWFSRGTARPDPAGRAFLALLACAAEKCSASRFAEYLSLGQVPLAEKSSAAWVPPEDEVLRAPREEPAPEAPERILRTPAAWERLLVDAAVIGGRDRWTRRLAGLEREFELRRNSLGDDDETRRTHLDTQLERLRNLREFAMPLIDALHALSSSALWADWLKALQPLARMSLRNPAGVLAVLAEFEPMGDVGPVSIEEVAEVLSERLRFLRAEPPQRRFGRVFVGSIEESRGCEFPVVFLPGLAEGLFPQRVLEDPLLLDDVRKELDESLPRRKDRNQQERERLHLAVAAAGERFIASYPRMDVAQARPRVPSFYALELPRALEGSLPKLEDYEKRVRDAAPARLNWPAPADTRDAIDDAEYDLATLAPRRGARYLMETNPHVARSLRARWARWHGSWQEADGLITENAEALAALTQHRLSARLWSASSLEQFAACPYKFALHGIYRLRPRDEAVPLQYLDPLTRGALFHEIQFALWMQLRESGALPINAQRLPAALAAADAVIERIASQYAEDLAPAIPRVWNTEIEDMRTDLRGWLQQVAQNDDDWQPLYFELAFGLENREGRDPASVETPVELPEGVRLRGSIDLVEKHLPTGALRVTDHKTGKIPETIPAVTGGGRVLQPLLYALAAEKLLGQPVESGRLFYATQRGAYQQIAIPVNDRARRFLAKLLQNIDQSIAHGFLPPLPEKETCRYCDYRPVCGPYEEQRAARHKNRRDERLDALHEIRGFL